MQKELEDVHRRYKKFESDMAKDRQNRDVLLQDAQLQEVCLLRSLTMLNL